MSNTVFVIYILYIDVTGAAEIILNPLEPNGKYMYHLL
jgi:hypothetical protein